MTTALARPTIFDDVPAYIPPGAKLPLIKISKESLMFELPGHKFTTNFDAHLLHAHRANAYWPNSYGEGESFPVCMSADGSVPEMLEDKVDGYTVQHADCETCPRNQFQEEGQGKECSNMMWLYLLIGGQRIPCKMKVPATSLGSGTKKKPKYVQDWLVQTASGQVHQALVKSKFSLERGIAGNFQIAIVKPEIIGAAETDEETKRVEDAYTGCKHMWSKAAKVATTQETDQGGEQVF